MGLCMPKTYIVVIRGHGKVRQEERRRRKNFLCLLDESGRGQSRVHARINGAAKPKLIGVSY